MPQISKISHTHDQLLDAMLANPTATNGQLAQQFGYTQAWVSTIIHSDLFQAKLQERQDEVFGEVAISVKDRITALAHDSLNRLHQKILVENDTGALIDASELAIKALGFGGQTNGKTTQVAVVVNNNVVSKDVLAEARARMEQRADVITVLENLE
jgi:hypothetical protein